MLKCLIYANRGASLSPAAITVVVVGGVTSVGDKLLLCTRTGAKRAFIARSLAPAFPPLFLLLRAFRDALVAIIHRALL